MSNTEHIVPDTTPIKISDKIYEIGKLSYKQITLFSRFMVRVVVEAKKKKEEAEKAGKSADDVIIPANSPTDISDILILRDSLEENMNAELFGIFINERDYDFIKKNVLSDGVLSADIVATVCEHNDFGKIFGNFLRTMEAQKKWTQGRPHSSSSQG